MNIFSLKNWFSKHWPTLLAILVALPFFFSFLIFLVGTFTVGYLFLYQPYQMKGTAMIPNLNEGQLFLGNRLYGEIELTRGEIVVFTSPKETDREIVRRVIGLPGEKVSLKEGRLYINDQKLDESGYLKEEASTANSDFLKENEPVVIPEGHYFLLSDNRVEGDDSRELGFIPKSNVIARYFLCYWKCR
ncbi:MAG TPA: signal peptidase I [Patescibacteria group bacterium]|nr:signal peptidase I [Patescibacteria group bacterium]